MLRLVTLIATVVASLADVTFYIGNGKMTYSADEPVRGIQFEHGNCEFHADNAEHSLNFHRSSKVGLGFSMKGDSLPAGDGLVVEFGGACNSIDNVIAAGEHGRALAVMVKHE
jgi:hypothetical protein